MLHSVQLYAYVAVTYVYECHVEFYTCAYHMKSSHIIKLQRTIDTAAVNALIQNSIHVHC